MERSSDGHTTPTQIASTSISAQTNTLAPLTSVRVSNNDNAVEGLPRNQAQNESETGPSTIRSPWDIAPPPLLISKTSNRGRKATEATIITSTLYKDNLAAAQSNSKNGKRNLFQSKTNKVKKSKPKVVPTVISSSSESSASDYKPDDNSSDDAEFGNDPPEDAVCLICEDILTESNWVQCIQCMMWAHTSCALLNKSNIYLCKYCI